jgi:hypothetical protein
VRLLRCGIRCPGSTAGCCSLPLETRRLQVSPHLDRHRTTTPASAGGSPRACVSGQQLDSRRNAGVTTDRSNEDIQAAVTASIIGTGLRQWDKLDLQLEGRSAGVVLLAAESFLRDHPLRSALPETRRAHIDRVLSHLDAVVTIPASFSPRARVRYFRDLEDLRSTEAPEPCCLHAPIIRPG